MSKENFKGIVAMGGITEVIVPENSKLSASMVSVLIQSATGVEANCMSMIDILNQNSDPLPLLREKFPQFQWEQFSRKKDNEDAQ